MPSVGRACRELIISDASPALKGWAKLDRPSGAGARWLSTAGFRNMNRFEANIFSVLLVVVGMSIAGFAQENLAGAPTSRTQVVVLGTGTPLADPERSGPAVAVVVN